MSDFDNIQDENAKQDNGFSGVRATFISPTTFKPDEELKTGSTIREALAQLGNDDDCIVKLNNTQQDLDSEIEAGSIYMIVPGTVARGGFDGGSL